jgi:hypothetical protein
MTQSSLPPFIIFPFRAFVLLLTFDDGREKHALSFGGAEDHLCGVDNVPWVSVRQSLLGLGLGDKVCI